VKRFYFVAVVLVLGAIVAGMMLGVGPQHLNKYLNIAGAGILLLPVLLLLKSQFSWGEMGRAFGAAFDGADVEKQRLEKALVFFTALQRYLIWMGLLGFLLGLIAMFSSISDYSALGRGMAIALLMLLYAFMLIIAVALPFQFALKKKIAQARGE
jgi:flagellar motor component MotA